MDMQVLFDASRPGIDLDGSREYAGRGTRAEALPQCGRGIAGTLPGQHLQVLPWDWRRGAHEVPAMQGEG